MAGRVDVSVVVPAYNVERYVDQALSSARQNDRISLEIIAVNDGSTDGTLDILRTHERADSRVRVIDRANAGYGSGVNLGFSEARGTYVAILEPDDWVEPHMYDELFSFARGFGGEMPPDVVKSSYWRIWMPETPEEKRLHCAYFGRVRPSRQPFTIREAPRLLQHHPSIWSALYRRDFLVEKGIRLKEVPGAGWVDNPFWYETLCQAESIVYTDTPYYCYREDLPGSSSATRSIPLSFERWNDMKDILERLDVTDMGVNRALHTVGFRFVGEAVRQGALDDPVLRGEMTRIFFRMDLGIVVGLDQVSPSLRALAFELVGRPCPPLSKGPYLRMLAGEFFYGARTNGPGFALSSVGRYFKGK